MLILIGGGAQLLSRGVAGSHAVSRWKSKVKENFFCKAIAIVYTIDNNHE